MDTSNQGTDAPLYSSRIFRNYIRLVTKRYSHVDIDGLLKYAGMELYQVEDDGHWFTQKQTNLFHDKLSNLTHENISWEAGRYTTSADSMGILRQYTLSLMGFSAVFENMGKWSRKFSRASIYKSNKLAPNKVELIVSPKAGVQEEPFQCQNRLGYIEGVSSLFNARPPIIEHPECLFKNGSSCRYIITWEESKFSRLSKIRNGLFLFLPAAGILSLAAMPAQVVLIYLMPSFLFACLAMGWYAAGIRIKELEHAMEGIRLSTDEQMEQISANYDNSLLINEVGQILNKEEEVEGVISAIVRLMQKRLQFDRGLILMANRTRTKLVYCSGYGFNKQQEEFLQHEEFPINDENLKSIFSESFGTKRARSVNNVEELGLEESSKSYRYIKKMMTRSIISCPILYENEPLGILAVDSISRRKRVYQRDINLLMGIATQIGARLHNISLHDRLRQSQKMEAVGSLAGGVAHDFNNILTTILGYSELTMRKLRENDPLQENIEAIHSAGERAARLTRQLLAFSRNQVMEMRVINLNDIVNEITKMLKRLIGADVEMETELSNSLKNILADVSQIEQILLNLTINARDAMPFGGKLVISTGEVIITEADELKDKFVPAGEYVVLTVRDTGVGMSDNIRERIFDPFFTTKQADKGTGLGLSTVYGIVKQHSGFINVYSHEGKGATFSVYFPVIDAKVERKRAREATPVVKGSATILAVDDDAEIRKLILGALEPLGFKVLVASNGREALEVSRKAKEKIDLVVSDVVMPEMNGRKLISTLRDERPYVKVILMSGYPAEIVGPNDLFEPGLDFISKPFTPSALTSKITKVLGAHEVAGDTMQ